MTSGIDRAKELLRELGGKQLDCTCDGEGALHAKTCLFERWIEGTPFKEIDAKAEDLLRGYIGAMEAHTLGECEYERQGHPRCGVPELEGFGARRGCVRCKAIAEFDKLFPEEVA